jgi:hypothetical protein
MVIALSSHKNRTRYALLVFGIICLVGVGVVGVKDWMDLDKAAITNSWPVVNGVVTEREVHNDDATSFLTYQYTVADKKYTSHRIWFDEPQSRAQSVLTEDLYPLGGRVEVHYDAKAPQMAVLSTFPKKGRFDVVRYFELILGTLFFFVAGLWRLNVDNKPTHDRLH